METFYISFKDTGVKVILIKVHDNKAVESSFDTFHIGVYEKFYTTFYDGNGNSGGTVPTDTNRYAQGQGVMVLDNAGNLVKTGYVFTGWNTQANGRGASYSAGANFTIETSNVTMYAQWTIIPTFLVAYNGNGNTGGNAPADNNHYILGQNVTVLGNTGSLVKTGFTFVGWNTQANGSGISYATGVAFTMGSSNVTLFAQWTANPTYTVTYNANGGTGAQTDSNQYLAGAPVTVRGQGTLVKDGYTFAGWTISSAGSGKVYAKNDTVIMGSVNVTLYAKWSITLYIVSFNTQVTGITVPSQTVSYGGFATAPTAPTRAGYTFGGWYKEAGCTNAWTFTTDAVTSDVTLYAKWTPLTGAHTRLL